MGNRCGARSVAQPSRSLVAPRCRVARRAAADDSRLRRVGDRCRRQRGRRAFGHRRSRLARRRDARPDEDDPLGAASRHVRRAGRRTGTESSPEACRALLRGSCMSPDRLAHGLPDAVHEGERRTRCHGSRAGSRRRGRDGVGRARQRSRTSDLGDQPLARAARARTRARRGEGVRARRAAARASGRGHGNGRRCDLGALDPLAEGGRHRRRLGGDDG